MLPGFCSRVHSFLKTKLLEEFQDGCLSACPSLVSEWNDLSNSGSPFCLSFYEEDIWFK